MGIPERSWVARARSESGEEQTGFADEPVRRMAAGISHDFNNLLTVIKGYADLVLADPELHGRARDQLEIVAQAADQAAVLVSRLMAFSQQQVLDRSNCDLNSIVRSVLERHQELPIDHIAFETELDPNLPTVRGDATLVADALDCLVTNAVDSMPTGGRIVVATQLVDAAQERHLEDGSSSWVVIEVVDNGCGIAVEVIGKIFNPYFTTRRTGRGMGLGLAAARGIIRQHGGRIEVQSRIDVGSCFRIWLPGKDRKPV